MVPPDGRICNDAGGKGLWFDMRRRCKDGVGRRVWFEEKTSWNGGRKRNVVSLDGRRAMEV